MNRLLAKIKTGNSWIPTLTKDQLISNYPKPISLVISCLIRLLLFLPNRLMVLILPKRLCALHASFAMSEFGDSKALPFVIKAQKHPRSRKLAIHYELHIAERAGKIENLLSKAYSLQSILDGRLESTMSWGFWTLSHPRYQRMLLNAKLALENEVFNDETENIRYLPEFTTNMGHLGYLTSYIGHYAHFDSSREIVIWPNQAPNKFFMSLVLDQSPLKIKTSNSKNWQKSIAFHKKDNLALSMLSPGKWRIEHCSGAYSNQNFPEMQDKYSFKLKFPSSRYENCVSKLITIGLNPNKWFVILHIRGNVSFNSNSLQARDADITRYKDFCEKIYDLGGQVIRMGNKNFSQIPADFLAVDYAHSELKSDEMDCWLWANCRWWTGNANGAAIAAYAFGAIRLITDQWFWDNLGPSTDYFMPKTLSIGGKVLNPYQTVNFDLSRRMALDDFTKLNAQLIDNTSTQLINAAVDLYVATEQSKGSIGENKIFHESEIQSEFNSCLRNTNLTQSMKIPNSYLDYLVNYLD